ncbi:MAG: phage tail protein [Burkholderiales bacterium]|nr:phage tail protein [Burkholderiales bacterium]
MADPFIGEIRVFGFNYPPRDWANCSGQLLPIQQNAALFSILGTNFGGNGTTNFALPDLRDRVASGPVQGAVGVEQGSETVALQVSEIPAHTHTLYGDTARSQNISPEAQFPARLMDANNETFIATNPLPALTALAPQSVGLVGNGQAHENRQPYLALNFCIALQGIFPTRP